MKTDYLNIPLKNEKTGRFRLQLLLSLISGILLSVSFTVLRLDWFAWFALVPFFYALYGFTVTGRKGFVMSLVFSLTFYLGMLTWMFRLHPLTWLGFSESESLLIITAGWFAFSLIEAAGLAFIGLVTGMVKPEGWSRFFFPVLLWVVIEWVQGLGEFGFTWGRLANSQFQNLYLIQSVNIFGSLFISGLIVAVNVIIAITLIDFRTKGRINTGLVSAGFAVLVLNFTYGFYVISSKTDEGQPVKTAVIQGNILSDQKWNLTLKDTVDTYLDLSYQAALKPEAEKTGLVVWPETAIPALITNPYVIRDLRNFTELTGAHLITGIFDQKEDRIYNSIAAIDPAGKVLGVYSKQHLVPFGEYLPFRDFLQMLMPKLSQMNALDKDLAAGETSGLISTPLGNIGGIVCFESIFPTLIRSSVNEGAELIVLVTNDSWYKDSKGVYQHNSQAVLRAVENDRYLVRAANTGISSIISPTGEFRGKLGPLVKGYISSDVKFRNSTTIYSRFGDFIAIISLISVIFLAIFEFRKKTLV